MNALHSQASSNLSLKELKVLQVNTEATTFIEISQFSRSLKILVSKMKGRKWILAKHFQGSPKKGDLELVEFNVPEIKDGGKFINNI